MMDRDYIIDNDIIGRYVAGTLGQEELDAFELAFFNDEDLAAMVLTEVRLRGALTPKVAPSPREGRRVASEVYKGAEPKQLKPQSRRGLLTRVAALAAVIIPTAWLLSPWQGFEGRSPRVLTQVLSLYSTRGDGGSPSLPVSPAKDAVVALHIDATQVPDVARSALLIPDGLAPQVLASFEEQQIDASNGLIIEVHAGRLPPGSYVLELRDGDEKTVQTLPFRMTLPGPE